MQQQTKEAPTASAKTTAVAYVRTNQAALLPINNCQEFEWMGKMIASSELFGQQNPMVGAAIVGICHQERKSWLWFMENFHMIKGKVSKKADAMLADFRRAGGVHEIVTRTDKEASCKFSLGKSKYTSTIKWEDCLNEPFIYIGKEDEVAKILEQPNGKAKLTMKAKYKTPRARMQMLWARCVSDGIRVVAPEHCQGVYTPEEVDDYAQEPKAIQVTGVASDAPYAATEAAAPTVEVQQPVNIECCPAGNPAWVGKRWDDESVFTTDILRQALNVQHPSFTPEMKDYIRGIIEKREPVATVTVDLNNNNNQEG